jgi:urease accessory protein
MLKFTHVTALAEAEKADISLTLTLPYERRIISRQRVELDNAEEAGLLLPRGTVLHDGDVIATEDDEKAMVLAAKETISRFSTEDSLQLARACYHLGNRHVPLQIVQNQISYQHDHVLDDMLAGLGMHITVEQTTFEPEPGAYGGGHSHHHSHD